MSALWAKWSLLAVPRMSSIDGWLCESSAEHENHHYLGQEKRIPNDLRDHFFVVAALHAFSHSLSLMLPSADYFCVAAIDKGITDGLDFSDLRMVLERRDSVVGDR